MIEDLVQNVKDWVHNNTAESRMSVKEEGEDIDRMIRTIVEEHVQKRAEYVAQACLDWMDDESERPGPQEN